MNQVFAFASSPVEIEICSKNRIIIFFKKDSQTKKKGDYILD